MTERPRIGLPEFDHVTDPRFRKLLGYWLDQRGNDVVPPISAIDPLQFPYALPLVWLCTVEDNPRDFRYRLLGEHVRIAHGNYPKDRTLREVTDPRIIDRVLGYFSAAVDAPAIVHVMGRIYAEADRPARGERMILPFADPASGRVSKILGVTVHSWSQDIARALEIPTRQVRTFTPVDGRPPWCEAWM